LQLDTSQTHDSKQRIPLPYSEAVFGARDGCQTCAPACDGKQSFPLPYSKAVLVEEYVKSPVQDRALAWVRPPKAADAVLIGPSLAGGLLTRDIAAVNAVELMEDPQEDNNAPSSDRRTDLSQTCVDGLPHIS